MHCSISGAPASSFEAPSGHLRMRLSWISALAARKIIGAPPRWKSVDGPDPEARKAKAGASKCTPRRCSLHAYSTRNARLVLRGPYGAPQDEALWNVDAFYSEYHRAHHDDNRGNRAAAHSDGASFSGAEAERCAASEGTPQRCSLQFTRRRRPRLALRGPFGRLGMRLSWMSALATRKIIGAPTATTEVKAARHPPTGPRPEVRRPKGLHRRRTRSRVVSGIHLTAADNGCCGQPFRCAACRVAPTIPLAPR